MASRSTNPRIVHGLTALTLTLVTAGAILLLVRPESAVWWLVAWLFGINATAFFYYGFDKSRARSGGRRVPEFVLHGLAVLGGSLGAYAGMQTFRHKTIKGSFRIVFWAVVVLQVLLVAGIVYRIVRD